MIYILELAYGLRWNTPVRIMDWPDLDINFDSVSNSEDEPVDGPDHDPEYAEQDELPGLNPIDEPQFANQEVWQLLELNLGDMADELWLNMCKSHHTPDYSLLTFYCQTSRLYPNRIGIHFQCLPLASAPTSPG
jgi:hypothetical protein